MRHRHNIVGSEAFHSRRPLILTDRPLLKAPNSLANRIYLAAATGAAFAALIDLMIGQPVCLTIGALIFLILWLRG